MESLIYEDASRLGMNDSFLNEDSEGGGHILERVRWFRGDSGYGDGSADGMGECDGTGLGSKDS